MNDTTGSDAAAPDAFDAGRLTRLRAARREMSYVLAGWAVSSVVIGTGGLFVVRGEAAGAQLLGAAAMQFAIWGVINAVFAFGGIAQARRADATPATPETWEVEDADRRRVLKILRFNFGLNWVWLATGVVLLAWGGATQSPALLGHGVGVLVQAAFLTVFDRVFHARLVAG